MFSTGLSEEIRDLLENITPYFQENIIRAFNNEGVFRQMRDSERFKRKLDDILLSHGDTKIQLIDLIFEWIPDFRVVNLGLDLPMLCINLDLKLGDLTVEGQYEACTLSLQRILPVSNCGKISFLFKDVTAKGRVGLIIEGDSFVPVNYDIKYTAKESEVSYFIANETRVENKIDITNGERFLGDAVWAQLSNILANLLDTQLGEAVVEFSVQEVLADQDEEIRALARDHSMRAARLVDSVLCSAKDYLVAKNFRSIKTPSLDIVFRGKPTEVHQGKFRTKEGYLEDLSTLSRQREFSLYEDKAGLVVYGSLALRDFKHGYEKYTGRLESTEVSGTVKTSVYVNTIFVRLVVENKGETGYNARLDDIRVNRIREVETDISGLASLSWLSPKVRSWVVGNLRQQAIPTLEKYLVDAFRYALEKTNYVDLINR